MLLLINWYPVFYLSGRYNHKSSPCLVKKFYVTDEVHQKLWACFHARSLQPVVKKEINVGFLDQQPVRTNLCQQCVLVVIKYMKNLCWIILSHLYYSSLQNSVRIFPHKTTGKNCLWKANEDIRPLLGKEVSVTALLLCNHSVHLSFLTLSFIILDISNVSD